MNLISFIRNFTPLLFLTLVSFSWCLDLDFSEDKCKTDLFETPVDCMCTWRLKNYYQLKCSNANITIKEKANENGIKTNVTIIECVRNTSPYHFIPKLSDYSKQNYLHLRFCSLPNGSFSDSLTNYDRFYFENIYLNETIKREHLTGLHKIHGLEIFTNKTLPNEIFDDLINLKILHLDATNLSMSILSGLVNLESLIIPIDNNFDSNQLKTLTTLTRFGIVSSSFDRVSKGLFAGISTIQHIFINDNTINTIDADAFQSLTQLKTAIITFDKNAKSFPDELFSNNSKLEDIMLTFNSNLTSISSNQFKGCFDLKKLTLYNNILMEIAPGAFSNLPELTEIDLAWNNLEKIEANVFENVPKLEKLDLSYNKLIKFDIDILKKLPALNILNLKGNRLGHLDKSLFVNVTNVVIDYQYS